MSSCQPSSTRPRLPVAHPAVSSSIHQSVNLVSALMIHLPQHMRLVAGHFPSKQEQSVTQKSRAPLDTLHPASMGRRGKQALCLVLRAPARFEASLPCCPSGRASHLQQDPFFPGSSSHGSLTPSVLGAVPLLSSDSHRWVVKSGEVGRAGEKLNFRPPSAAETHQQPTFAATGAW